MTQNDGGKYHCETYNNKNITQHVFVSVFDKMDIKPQSSGTRKHKSQHQDKETKTYYDKKREQKPINEDFLVNKGPITLLIKPIILSLNIVSTSAGVTL